MFRFLSFFSVLLPVFFWGIDPRSPFQQQTEEASPPNPADLKITWWDYYDVSDKTLTERRTATELYFSQIKNGLSEEDLERAQPLFDQILIRLQTLIDLKSQPAKIPTSPPLKKKSYTYPEWLALGQRLLESERELEYLALNLNLVESSYKSGSKYIDTLFAAYLKSSKTGSSKLLDGLVIMQGRISLAVEKIQVANLKVVIEEKMEMLVQLREEAERSYKRVDFKTVSLEEINQQLSAEKEREAQAYNRFIQVYENVPRTIPNIASLEEEIVSQNFINAKLDYEIDRIRVINLEIQKIIVGFMKKEEKISHKVLREKLEQWEGEIQEFRREIPNSESTSEFVLQQSLRSLSFQGESQQEAFSRQSLQLSQEAILKIQQLNNVLFIHDFFIGQVLRMKGDMIFGPADHAVAWWENSVGFFKAHAQWFNRSLFKIGDFPVTPSTIIKFVVILVLSFFLARLARTLVNHLGKKQKRVEAASVYILSRLSYYFVVILGLLIAGRAIGLDLTIFAYLAGAIALWIGFSLQSIFHNFISGIIVLLTRSVSINDFLELDSGELGSVVEINLRTTVLKGLDGRHLIIPNADLVNKKFYNHTYTTYLRRLHIPFRISLDENKEVVSKIIQEAAKKVPMTSEYREPELWVMGYGDHYRQVELVVWVNGLIAGKLGSWFADYYWAIDDALKANNIHIPIPQRDIRVSPPEKPIATSLE